MYGLGTTTNGSFGIDPATGNAYSGDYSTAVEIVAAHVNNGAEKVFAEGSTNVNNATTLWMDNGLNELWGMGQNNKGQLGNNSTTDSSTPVRMRWGNTTDSYILGAAAGNDLSAWIEVDGLKALNPQSEGNLIVCGENNNGQLGDGTTTDRHIPVKIDTNVVKVSAGWLIAYIKSDGSLWKTYTGSPYTPQQVVAPTTNGGGAVEVNVQFINITYTKLDGSLWLKSGNNTPSQIYP
jgi:hypothetical protein